MRRHIAPLKMVTFGLIVAASLAACAADADRSPKPQADPDTTALATGKTDATSNWWTTIVGALATDDAVKASIDYPDWFHGYTMELSAGQTVELRILASEDGVVRFYGPAHKVVGEQPLFKKALVRGTTTWNGHAYEASFEATATEGGTYMVVYGPIWYWQADYSVESTCVAGCQPDEACGGDDECAEGEYCGHNGVYCFTTPCDVSFDICKPAEGEGAWCDRDAMCAGGLTCKGEVCTAGAPDGGACKVDSDCADGFCGCTDSSCSARVCKPFAGEGDSCGGFVLPHLYQVCDPALTCAAPAWVADIPGTCSVKATVAEILDDPKALDGRWVAIDGHVEPTWAMCTKMACGPDNPCCNSCGAQQLLVDAKGEAQATGDGLQLRGDDGQTYGCGGDECTWADQCTTPTGRYFVTGVFHYEGEYQLVLDVDSAQQF